MDIFVVCASDISGQYGCYIDSTWTALEAAESRRDSLNSQEAYSHDEPWDVETIPVDRSGGWDSP